MSAFSFNTTYQPTGDQQKDAIAQIGIMQNNAVKASLAYQSNQDSGALFKVLHQVNNELHDLLDSLENHTPLVRKNADELIALLLLFTRQVGQSRTDLI
ncbi:MULTISPECIES: hypothetical protein [Enterobacteriaceae]|jgi:hypothetical protein|uniref:Uncharacterized protein n=3 Tax=Escherichia coli TaxID=562 RepID=A0A075MDX2_ECOLX|nr:MULTISPECIES: hypothetical protein [Enterobacteriaceae]EAM2425690.1 hypothetical protein [Salmonella enterica]ECI2412048.1 hypothetical protein [Salmonella enterica subsp. enterica serovar Heidelberg]ECY3162747.1 hypothetical protein [Salmonella enterica subsp. enterica serovar Derby]EEZ5671034.1 hypothetical protein [Escherichia coli O2]EEZ5681441.1 hypothetical protein [Escherichia coli O25]EEZ5757099.1 hypothetical protein [Escherichia coli O15]EEZ5965419.1 hypothetical protein [Escher